MDLISTAALKCGRFVGRSPDGTHWLDSPEHGNLWFHEGSVSVCCAEKVTGDWKLGDIVRIVFSTGPREGATEIAVQEMMGISNHAEKMVADLMRADDVSGAAFKLWEQYEDGESIGPIDERQVDDYDGVPIEDRYYTPGSFWYTVEKL